MERSPFAQLLIFPENQDNVGQLELDLYHATEGTYHVEANAQNRIFHFDLVMKRVKKEDEPSSVWEWLYNPGLELLEEEISVKGHLKVIQ